MTKPYDDASAQSPHEAVLPAISAILPLYNKRAYVDRCLASVLMAARAHGAVEVVVVDHNSTDGSFEAAARWEDSIRLYRDGEGTIAHVRNIGARLARAPILAFIDSDCVVPPNYFISLEIILRDRGVAATGFEVGVPDAGSWVERTWHQLHDRNEPGPRHYLNSANFAVTRAAFESVAGFDERLVTGEDTDICLRLRSKGFDIWASPELRSIHLDNPTTLAAFYRKELWRGLGGFSGTVLRRRIRSSAMVIAFGFALGAALVLAFSSPALWSRVLGAVAIMLAIPMLTVAFRYGQTGRITNPLRSVTLYLAFYLARLAALVVILSRRVRTFRRGTSISKLPRDLS